MALHGEIKVNRRTIGDWAAVRKERTAGDWHRYDCSVNITPMESPTEVKWFDFSVSHSFRDGAMVLAAKVLLEANRRMNDES